MLPVSAFVHCVGMANFTPYDRASSSASEKKEKAEASGSKGKASEKKEKAKASEKKKKRRGQITVHMFLLTDLSTVNMLVQERMKSATPMKRPGFLSKCLAIQTKA